MWTSPARGEQLRALHSLRKVVLFGIEPPLGWYCLQRQAGEGGSLTGLETGGVCDLMADRKGHQVAVGQDRALGRAGRAAGVT